METEYRLQLLGTGARVGNRKLMLNGYRVSVWGDEKDSEIDTGYGCVILGMYLMLLNYVLKNS